jgi:hypothetical protein
MTFPRILLILACLVLASGFASASISFAVCGTGFTSATCTTEANTTGTGVDFNWKLESAPPVTDCSNTPCTAPPAGGSSAPVSTVGDFPGAWVADNSTSEWISPRTNETGNSDPDSAVTPYVYTETFIIPATINASTVVITGGWSVDNYGSILVNGNAVTLGQSGALGSGTTGAFGIVTPFTLDGSGTGSANAPSLHVGSNTLTFDVFNNANGTPDVTGVNIEITSALGQASAPEPASIAIMGLGLAALGGLFLRKRNA